MEAYGMWGTIICNGRTIFKILSAFRDKIINTAFRQQASFSFLRIHIKTFTKPSPTILTDTKDTFSGRKNISIVFDLYLNSSTSLSPPTNNPKKSVVFRT